MPQRPPTHVWPILVHPDELHVRAVAAGAEVIAPPFDTDYGSRDVGFRDPEGNLWHYGTYPGS